MPNVNTLQASSLLSVKMGTLISLSSKQRDERLCDPEDKAIQLHSYSHAFKKLLDDKERGLDESRLI